MHEAVTLLRVWPTVDFDNQRIFLAWIEVSWLEYPAVHRPVIYSGAQVSIALAY